VSLKESAECEFCHHMKNARDTFTASINGFLHWNSLKRKAYLQPSDEEKGNWTKTDHWKMVRLPWPPFEIKIKICNLFIQNRERTPEYRFSDGFKNGWAIHLGLRGFKEIECNTAQNVSSKCLLGPNAKRKFTCRYLSPCNSYPLAWW